MKERVYNFGNNNELSGILTLAESEYQKKNVPSILFLNAGFLHKTGFNRFNTDLARLLSIYGYSSLRFDLHGLGDSASCPPSIDYEKQAIIDIQQAIDEVTAKSDTQKCIIIGLCSGADFAHTAAVIDSRISGLVLMDGYAYRTLGYYIRDYGPGIINPYRSVRFAVNQIRKRFFSATYQKDLKQSNEVYIRSFPPKKLIMKQLQELINRGVKLFFIYSGGVPLYYNYEDQFFDMFRSVKFKGMVFHRYFKEADHTYTIMSVRQKLKSTISEWISYTFP
jgi:pimeloyl-ACP methyl ester carboxylesterase